MAKRTIRQLMTEYTPEERDLPWLLDSLQSAVELELSTLPPYLCAYWSVNSSSDPSNVGQLILDIALEEMGHMGLVANMLNSLGGTPQINTNVPTYPGHLPGDVRPELVVYLAGLSKPFLFDVCMQIEYPDGGPIAREAMPGYTTIGAFYNAIEETIVELKPTFTGERQLTTSFGSSDAVVFAINNIEDALKAIQIIKHQGEGTEQSPYEAGSSGEFAHYYTFAEVYYGKALIQVDDEWRYLGDPITFPEVYPMAKVPPGGYQNPPEENDVAKNLKLSNAAYKTLLDLLQEAWAKGSSDALNSAIGAMFDLATPCIALIKTPGAPQGGNWGPDFIPG